MNKRRFFGSLGGVALCLVALGADDKLQTIDANGLTFQAPGSWKSVKPSSRMRRAQMTIEPAKSDTRPAELVVTAFPGGAGTVEDNIKRWQNQFRSSAGDPAKAETKKVKGKNVDVTRVEVAGQYTDPFDASKSSKSEFRLLGAIVETKQASYYLKLVGPDKTVKAAENDFDKMLATIKAED